MSEITKCPKCSGEYVYFDGHYMSAPIVGMSSMRRMPLQPKP